MPHYYLIGHEPGPEYLYDTDPGAPFVLFEAKPTKVTKQAPAPENEV